MLVRGDSLAASMSQYLVHQIKDTGNIQVEYRSRVVEVHGQDHLEAISIQCDQTGDVSQARAAAIFIFIGAEPRTAWLDGTVERDPHGFILTGPDLMRDGKRPQGGLLDRGPGVLGTGGH